MMNQDIKLKLQAYLDNELSESETREFASWLERDAEARVLQGELNSIKSTLAGNEVEVKLPESREFYWSKIERAIRHGSQPKRGPAFLSGYPWWVRWCAPALGVAVLLVAALSVIKLTTAPTQVSYLHEIETPLEDTGAISFHSQEAGMTVVWVQSQGN
jgi:anti-sigma factor RsiW